MGEVSRLGQVSGGDIRQIADDTELHEFPNVERSDFVPRMIAQDETELLVQRHGKFDKNVKNEDGTENPNAGKLTHEAIAEEELAAEDFIRRQIELVPEGDRDTLYILFVASDTSFEQGKRSTETGNIALAVARRLFREYGLLEEQILNSSPMIKGGEGVRPTPILREPAIFTESPNFVQHLRDKYGEVNDKGEVIQGRDFWVAFEEDLEKEMREEMGAEGPDDLADRLKRSLAIFFRFSRQFHQKNPGKRLVVWAATHYDTISPFVKRDVYGVEKSKYIDVDYGSGLAIKIDKEGVADTLIGGKSYPVTLN